MPTPRDAMCTIATCTRMYSFSYFASIRVTNFSDGPTLAVSRAAAGADTGRRDTASKNRVGTNNLMPYLTKLCNSARW